MKPVWSWKLSLMLADGGAVAAGFLAAYWLRFVSGLVASPKGVPPLAQHVGYLLFVLVVWLGLFRACGLYRQRVQGTIDEAYSIAVGVAAGSIALLGAAYWQQAYWYSRGLLVLAAVLTASFMLLARRLLRGVWRGRYLRGQGVVPVLLVGDAVGCAPVAAALGQAFSGYRLLGRVAPPYLTEREALWGEPAPAKAVSAEAAPDEEAPGDTATPEHAAELEAPAAAAMPVPAAFPLWGDWARLQAELSRPLGAPSVGDGIGNSESGGGAGSDARPREIVLVGNCLRAADMQLLADRCSSGGCTLRLVPDIIDIVKRSSPVEEVVGVPLLTLSAQPLGSLGRAAKRTLDLAVAIPVALLLAPLMAAIALAVKLSSPGPVFYAQIRCGRDGRPFAILKFRSMSCDAEGQGVGWTTRGDRRVTPLGRWLRRSSLDELPQLVNVLKGEMSLVGPRPERPVYVEKFGTEIPRYHERHRMPAGITGWAQVNGLRGDTPIALRTLYDLYYVENWSVALDVKILLKTLCEVLFHREAY